MEQGGHLLVDADRGQTVEGLPPAWQPGADGRAAAGRGEVRLTAGAIAAGQWSGLVEPTGWAVTGDPGIRFGNGFVGQALANEAGLRVPRLGWLVAFLVLYVLMAGPVVFFVVRRRGHPELAWVAVPLVAVLFTAGSYVGGRGLRDTTRQVDTSVVATGPAGSTAATWTGVFSSGGQTSRVRFGPGWTPSGQSDIEISTSLSSVTITPDGTEGSLPLDAGQFGIVAANGPVASEGALEVTSTATGADRAVGPGQERHRVGPRRGGRLRRHRRRAGRPPGAGRGEGVVGRRDRRQLPVPGRGRRSSSGCGARSTSSPPTTTAPST